ncbi:histone H2A deubiquitinase MYSM1 [Brachyhypopomus gauderio]|uniref:histone H2A deubiquitinase MYSM1 n=1 Tax=Brachyhypopomus gauderio TaxID=698409 RepID=UPI00404103ED
MRCRDWDTGGRGHGDRARLARAALVVIIGNMADEMDVVDIEGDECGTDEGDTGAVLLQDDYLQSAWKSNTAVLPWALDSSISEENREVIESMLLEEQYYFAGKKVPKVAWTTEKHKVKKSPVKSSGSVARWSQEEKNLFEKGLTQFGRRWTKISKLVGTRTVLQVKSYARQYFKNKDKADGHAVVSSDKTQSMLLEAPPTGSTPHSIQPRLPTLTNAIRIERLSDDEDVDITDDLSDEASQPESHSNLCDEPKASDQRHDPVHLTPIAPSTDRLTNHITNSEETSDRPVRLCPGGTADVSQTLAESEQAWQEEACCSAPSPATHTLPGDESAEDKAGKSPDEEVEEEQEEEEEELKAPEQEVTLDTSSIAEEEKQAIPEFFEGRPSKTPERYLKIRNYILDQWERSKPKYLNKTSVRPGLKNCGDVNCIGRIHTYLELIGAINFNCDQAIYNRPRPVDRSRAKENRDSLETYQLAQRLQSMRTRKRRVRDAWGNWCDVRDLEGHTYEHLSAEELALRREEVRKRQPRPCKVPRHQGTFDPFQLIPCKAFGEDTQEPFRVIVCAEALVVMDVHAHVSMGEVIGLLGGSYSEEEKVLKVCAAEPCNSLSTGLQCEMDPVSQTQASELLEVKGHSVVGWYHSHPAFEPNPSLRDIDTQAKYQSYFSRGGAPFLGMIVSPYNPTNPSPESQTTCLLVQEEAGPAGPQKLPFKFEYEVSAELPDWTGVMKRAEWVVFKYRQSHGCIPMERLYCKSSSLTCLEKMLVSLRKILAGTPEAETFLVQMETLFMTRFIVKQESVQDETISFSVGREPVTQYPLHISAASEPTDSDLAFDFEETCATERPLGSETRTPGKTCSPGPENHLSPSTEAQVPLIQTGAGQMHQ